jgi:uncharacterized protein involved in exopolysaccharide biosynthesis
MAINNIQPPVYQYGVKELIDLLWERKLLIILVTLLFSILSVIYSLNIENTYKSEVLLESARNSESSLGQSAAQLGQLASLAGFSIPGAAQDSTTTDLALLESRIFISQFIEKNKLLIPLFAANSWDANENNLLLDNEIYNSSNKEWVRKVKPPYNSKPSKLEAIELFKDNFEVQHDKMTGLMLISFEFYSPYFAKELLDNVVQQFNLYVKTKELSLINANISYLEKQAEQIKNTGMKSVFYSLLEEQQKKIMLASSSDEYVFRVIDPAVIPEKKFAPKRAIICVLGTFLGFFLSIIIILFIRLLKG